MRDHVVIGATPAEEDCAQVGAADYTARSFKECTAFMGQLKRLFPNIPYACRFAIKAFQHDFGTYREVVVYYDDGDPESMNFAFDVENNAPETWDEAAKAELQTIAS